MRIFQSFQLKAGGFVYSHTVATGQYRAVYLYFAFYEEDVHSGVRLVQVIAQLLSGLDFSDGEPCLLQQLGGSIPVGRYDERKLVLVQIGADVIILIGYSVFRALPRFGEIPPVRYRFRSFRCGRYLYRHSWSEYRLW